MKNLLTFIGGTLSHKALVFWYLFGIAGRLFWRGVTHDLSKFGLSEAPLFIGVIDRLKGSTYGSPEYRETLREIKPAIYHHNRVNPHHPEHFPPAYRDRGVDPGGIRNMDLVDLTEMVCDWKAAAKRHQNGDPAKSLEVNRERFGIPDMLVEILRKHLVNREG